MVINVSYIPKEMAKHVDFVNLMTYDFYIHKWYWPFIGHNSALYPRAMDSGLAYTFNTEWAANYWHQRGLPKEKIMVGIAAYGKRYTLYSKYLNYPGAIAVSSHADCTYSDVCDFLNLNATVQVCSSKCECECECVCPFVFT
jgi:GH18 family chitinase